MAQELKKALGIQFLVYIKEYNSRVSKWERCPGQSMEVKGLAPVSSSGAPLMTLIHTPNQNAIIRVF